MRKRKERIEQHKKSKATNKKKFIFLVFIHYSCEKWRFFCSLHWTNTKYQVKCDFFRRIKKEKTHFLVEWKSHRIWKSHHSQTAFIHFLIVWIISEYFIIKISMNSMKRWKSSFFTFLYLVELFRMGTPRHMIYKYVHCAYNRIVKFLIILVLSLRWK